MRVGSLLAVTKFENAIKAKRDGARYDTQAKREVKK
jgi:hypothetical protein